MSVYSNYVTKMDTHPRSAPQTTENGQTGKTNKKGRGNDKRKQGMTNAGTVGYIKINFMYINKASKFVENCLWYKIFVY